MRYDLAQIWHINKEKPLGINIPNGFFSVTGEVFLTIFYCYLLVIEQRRYFDTCLFMVIFKTFGTIFGTNNF